MFDEKMCKRIKKKMIDKGISQKQLAENVGSSLAYVNMILNSRCENLELESKILKELKIDDTRATA